MTRFLIVALVAALAPLAGLAGEAPLIETRNFVPEAGVNRSDAALQYNVFFLGSELAHEITHEWAAGAAHQISYTIALFTAGRTGLGDAAINYRYQLAGGAESRFAVAPRATLLLPTRSRALGDPVKALQLVLPVTAVLGRRLVSHTNAGFTWYGSAPDNELQLTQTFALAASDRVNVLLDAAYTRTGTGEHDIVVRPGLQFAFSAGPGLQIAPGIAVPVNGSSRGVMVFLALEQLLTPSP